MPTDKKPDNTKTMQQPQQPYDTHAEGNTDSQAVTRPAASKQDDPLEKDRHEKTHGDVSIGTSG